MGPRWLMVWHDFSKVSFWATRDRKTISSEVLSWSNGGKRYAGSIGYDGFKKEKKVN